MVPNPASEAHCSENWREPSAHVTSRHGNVARVNIAKRHEHNERERDSRRGDGECARLAGLHVHVRYNASVLSIGTPP